MKKYIQIILLFTATCSFLSCEQDNLDPLGNWELKPATIELPSDNTTIELDELTPNETVTFSWLPAVSTANYTIKYSIVFDTIGSTSFDSPILELSSANNGKDLSLGISNSTINEYLSYSGYPANEIATITWAVKAKCLDKVAYASQDISFKRFSTELTPTKLYVSGTATENNTVLSTAIEMKRLNNSDGNPSNKHEIFTTLTAGNSFKFYSEKTLPCHQYGNNNDGDLIKSGNPIVITETAQYRISVDLENNTYDLLKIDNWSIVGDPINGGWSGDTPLTYQGGGIWKSSVQLINTGNFVFRANGDWSYLLKRIQGSTNKLVMESDATSQGITFEDIPSSNIGNYLITLNLSSSGYTYTIQIDTSAPDPIATPNQLFLLANGTMIEEFSKNGDLFSLDKFIPFQSSVNYSLNSDANGTGTSYSINGQLGVSSSPDGDKVTGNNTIVENATNITINNDRGLKLSIDFSQATLNWEYYNFKLFHWQVWEDRDELVMTYQHPNTYTITTPINGGYEMKFISPWDFDMGSNSPNGLTGNITNGSGSNITNVATNGNYLVTIVLDGTYQSGTYSFVQQ
ncbi:hypothetical protein FIA58_003505 [Flavobacterium jejuense]|uniref:SusE outer membrane protein domain-containing protein n=1 Tax=Flavobacterium jejuense TaxID=1544455 RepID=A0ABX0IQI1_9FLAO|nr:SusE domain-containing protein [Flavobacterium jejuense]NHN24733.1 hypothetical protein [Flavobacterium jejuense]